MRKIFMKTKNFELQKSREEEMINLGLASLLRNLREATCLTQSQLAELMDTEEAVIILLEGVDSLSGFLTKNSFKSFMMH